MARVRANTAIRVDCNLGSFYFATARGAFPWHQDHESYFTTQNHFDYLNLDAGGVRQFVADYERFRPNFRRRSPLPPDVYTTYLMSTDFFQGDADDSRPVRYVLFYDPELTRCHNPLARFAET